MANTDESGVKVSDGGTLTLSNSTITTSGNGHTVYYVPGACAALGGKTYVLSGGGQLKPAN